MAPASDSFHLIESRELAVDENSKQTVSLLNEIGGVIDTLRSFGYSLYLKTRAHSWGNPHTLALGGTGSERGLVLGTWISLDATRERTLIFGLNIGWTASHWLVKSYIDDQDGDRELITNNLWSSPDFTATTIEAAIQHLRTALAALVASVNDGRVAECIASIQPRE